MVPLEAMQRRSAATSVVTTAQQPPQLPWSLTCFSEGHSVQAVRPSKDLGSFSTSSGKATLMVTGASETLMIRVFGDWVVEVDDGFEVVGFEVVVVVGDSVIKDSVVVISVGSIVGSAVEVEFFIGIGSAEVMMEMASITVR